MLDQVPVVNVLVWCLKNMFSSDFGVSRFPMWGEHVTGANCKWFIVHRVSNFAKTNATPHLAPSIM